MSLKSRIEKLQTKAGEFIEPQTITARQRAKVERRLEQVLTNPAELQALLSAGGFASEFLRARLKV